MNGVQHRITNLTGTWAVMKREDEEIMAGKSPEKQLPDRADQPLDEILDEFLLRNDYTLTIESNMTGFVACGEIVIIAKNKKSGREKKVFAKNTSIEAISEAIRLLKSELQRVGIF